MNIAFIHNTFPAGGAERVTIDIARYLKTCSVSENGERVSDYNVFVFATSENDTLKNIEYKNSLTVYKVPSASKKRSAAIENLVKELQVDILVQVVAHIYDISGIRKRTGVKLIFANHGEPFWQRYSIMARRQNRKFKKWLWKLFLYRIYSDEYGRKAYRMAVSRNRKIYDNCDVYTVLCEAYKKHICNDFGIEPYGSHIVAIENSENIRDNVNYDKDKIILYCGRLDNLYKRVDRLLRIWAKVQYRLPEWRLQILGDGRDRKMLEQIAENLGLERVTFEGEHADVQKYYDRASILVQTSQSEGWSLCLTEAQASGVIPIAFSCSAGVCEILGPDGINGYLVKCFDEDAFAETLLKVVNLPEEEKSRIRHNAVSHRAQYSPEIIAEKWKALFDNLAEGTK